MRIRWKQVLEIETYINKFLEQNDPMFIWRWQSVNNGVRVDLSKEYTFSDLHDYLLDKYPKDEFIKNQKDGITELFNACAVGQRISEIDPELLEINEQQDTYRLDDIDIKNNILNRCASFTGATSFYLRLLKTIIESKSQEIKHIDQESQRFITNLFENFDIDNSSLNTNFALLKEKVISFMQDSRFKSFVSSCSKNRYIVPYSVDEPNVFLQDVLKFAKSEVIEIINDNSKLFFSYKVRKNESPYAEDLRRSQEGDINFYTTLHGLLNYDKILEMKSKNTLEQYIHNIMQASFEVLPKDAINDDSPGYIVSGNRYNSSLIIGSQLEFKNLYNKYLDDYHNKVINGTIWFNDDVHGISYDYLNFHEETDYQGEYKYSIPFINVIVSYHIAYLEKSRIERDFEDLRNNGYYNSKNELNQEGDNYNDNEYDDDFIF